MACLPSISSTAVDMALATHLDSSPLDSPHLAVRQCHPPASCKRFETGANPRFLLFPCRVIPLGAGPVPTATAPSLGPSQDSRLGNMSPPEATSRRRHRDPAPSARQPFPLHPTAKPSPAVLVMTCPSRYLHPQVLHRLIHAGGHHSGLDPDPLPLPPSIPGCSRLLCYPR